MAEHEELPAHSADPALRVGIRGPRPHLEPSTTRAPPTRICRAQLASALPDFRPTRADSSDVVAYRPVSRSGDTQPVADSSTSTAKQPDSPQHRPTQRQHIRFDAPAPPPHAPTPTSRKFTEHPNAFPAPTGPVRAVRPG